MIYPKIALAQSILQILEAKGIQNIIISPGSRNAPLTIGFVNNPFFKCYSIVDERSAAFFALGIAQQTQKPVVVVCTSGSALLNYYPAFAEAFYSEIPLIVISADRPFDKIDIGDGQTIRQQNVFENHSLFNANLSQESSIENDILINTALNKALTINGPVHINVPFEEPLYETTTTLITKSKIEIPEYKIEERIENWSELLSIWQTSKKKLILVGSLFPNSIDDKITDWLANEPSTIVMTEATSNWQHHNFISSIDSFITPFSTNEYENFRPELLVTFGGMIVSKRIKAMLRTYQPKHHWHIDTNRWYDTFGCLTDKIQQHPNSFLKILKSKVQISEGNYLTEALQIKDNRIKKHTEYLKSIPFSDFKVFELIISILPKSIQLQVSNSSAIRYVQLLEIDKSIEVFCNRGTSGIDGSTSTAIGAAVGSEKPTVFITGDIGFFYDSNALWNNYNPSNFKIILINNGGGGIFRILPGHSETPVFNTFFETNHQLTAENFAKMYRLNYEFANDEKSLESELKKLFSDNSSPTILEVFTPTKVNDRVLLEYFKALK